jgi:thiamine-monophosphate kinase
MQTVSQLGEDALIRRVSASLTTDKTVLAGVGDDCAVVSAPGAGRAILLKTDAVVENVHFRRDTPPRLIGRKALARVVSDIAAMGGAPHHAMITLVMRRATEVSFVEEVYAGLRDVAAPHGINIVGGETSRGDTLVISVSLMGSVAARSVPGRRGGRAGDALYVTGRLGGSIRGRHLTFTPRVAEGQWLMKNFAVHAMMDLSDGLAKDLPRLAGASALEFAVDEGAIPCTRGCTAEQAWADGEDYELLFALSPRSEERLMKEWRRKFPETELTRIGALVAAGEGIVPSFASKGWDHFGT